MALTDPVPGRPLPYPEARREDAVETMGGVTFADPYRWLEEDSDEALDWQSRQNRLAEEQLYSWPGFEAVRALVEQFTVDTRVFPPRPSGGRWFQQVMPTAESDQPALVVRDQPAGAPTVLMDANELSVERGRPVAIDWFVPSPDGRLVAVGVSEAGNEQSILHLIDVDSGDLLPERILYTGGGALSWLPDASGFYYSGGLGPQTETMATGIFFHKVGAPAPALTDYEPLDLVPTRSIPQLSDDGRYVAAISGDYRMRPFYFRDRNAGTPWQPLLRDFDGCHYFGFFDGDHYIALTTDGAPLGRVVAIPLSSPTDQSSWREIVPESEANIRSITRAAGGRILLSELVDARTRIRVVAQDGAPGVEVPAPGPGLLVIGGSSHDSKLVSLLYTAVDTSLAIYLYDVESGQVEPLTPAAHHATGIVSRQDFATSPDGTRVPMTIVHREELDSTRAYPTLIYAYGGFNLPLLPSYSPMHLAFVEAGGVLVMPNLRGGGEYGESWWEAGRRANKQNTFDDLYAVAERLTDSGVAAPSKLAVIGYSNGGLLTGVAVTQRPDMWAAVVSVVPIYDLFRTVLRDPYGSYATTHEYGDPRVPDEAEWLIRYSPYQGVREGTAYPPILISAGGNDIRCPPWHSRKVAAAMQSASSSSSPVLFRVHDDIGHGPGRPSSAAILNEAEWISFVMAHLGMDPPAIG